VVARLDRGPASPASFIDLWFGHKVMLEDPRIFGAYYPPEFLQPSSIGENPENDPSGVDIITTVTLADACYQTSTE
jgi:hypothetical protein